MLENKEYLFSRRIAGETYNFYKSEITYTCVEPWETRETITVYTPENGLGYPDIISFNHDGTPYTYYRYLAPWKLNRISEIIDANNLTEYTINGGKLVEEGKHGN